MYKLFVILSFVLVCLPSCENNRQPYCEKLVNKASNPEVSNKLINWFDENFKNKEILKNDEYIFGGLYVPGSYTYKKPFDWALIDFNERRPLVKLIDIEETDAGSEVFAIVNSISLAERSRVSILVQSNKFDDYGLGKDNQSIIKVTDRVAVYCYDTN